MSNVMRVVVMVGALLAGPASHADFMDNFDSYTPGAANQGGWKGWDNTSSAEGVISTTLSLSSPNSLEISGAADAVHEFTGATSGVWTFSMLQYVPGSSTGSTYVILMNDYADGGPYDWSVQLNCDMTAGTINSELYGSGSTTLLTDQWVELKFVIDFGSNSITEYYNGATLSTHAWTTGTVVGMKAVDLYANGSDPVYYDNVQLIPEPLTASLFGLAGVVIALRRRRMARQG
jgi:hypothetical protein